MNELPVKNPLKWDAEHPNLYTLTITLSKDGKEIGRFDRRIGFRDVKIEKDRMLVNGMPVKLRGACRHDIHPTLGRTTTAELDSLDVILFKRSNMNLSVPRIILLLNVFWSFVTVMGFMWKVKRLFVL